MIGRQPVIDALKNGPMLDRIYMQATIHGTVIDEIKDLARENGVPVNKVPVEKLNNMNVSNHEGCIGQILKVHYKK